VKPVIELKGVGLEYLLHLDRTRNLKEFVIQRLTGKRWVEKPKESFLALNGVDLTIVEGERVGIIGFNGAGKSTLLKVVSGILKPTFGTMKVHGTVQPLIELGAGFEPEFSGRENIYFNSYMLGFTKRQVDEKIDEIVEFAELGEFIDMPVKYYSSGMHVRLAFTIATTIEPQVLLLDEMLAAGDASFIDRAKKRMTSLIEQAKCLLVVSHNLEMLKELCSRVILMDRGKVAADGDPKAVIEEFERRAAVSTNPIGVVR
jgi:ABC-type polysaccharide/polyol phosphate transport system ATPase subunit